MFGIHNVRCEFQMWMSEDVRLSQGQTYFELQHDLGEKVRERLLVHLSVMISVWSSVACL